MIDGTEIHHEVSHYRAKPLDEVMSRMGKKVVVTPIVKREMDHTRTRDENEGMSFITNGSPDGDRLQVEPWLSRPYDIEDSKAGIELEFQSEEYEDEDGQHKRRRRPSQSSVRRKK